MADELEENFQLDNDFLEGESGEEDSYEEVAETDESQPSKRQRVEERKQGDLATEKGQVDDKKEKKKKKKQKKEKKKNKKEPLQIKV